MANIIDFYDSELFQAAGGVTLDRSTLAPRFQNGLFHLVYAIVYDKVTRDELRKLRPSPELTVEAIRTALANKFEKDYGVTGVARDTLIALHLAGVAWVAAYNAGDAGERDRQEAIFKQQLAVVTWLLWEDGTGQLFPLPW